MGIKEIREALTSARKSAFPYASSGGGMVGMGTMAGASRIWQGPVTGSTFFGNGLPGSDLDYDTAAGVLWLNGVVMAAIKWTSRTFNEAPLVVRKRIRDPLMPDPVVEDHPLTLLYNNPCQGFNATRLSAGYLLSRLVDGNGYLVKMRNDSGRVVELHYVPHYLMTPRWIGNDFITAYEYRIDTRRVFYDPRDVIVFQDGTDPDNQRKGLSALRAVMREIVTDNEAATYSVSILRQMGIPGAVIGPAILSTPEQLTMLPGDFGPKVKAMWGDRFAGDGRGKPLVFDFPVSVEFPNVSPENMALDKLRSIPVNRVLSVIGINSTVLHLQVDGQPKFANYKEAREAATQEYLVPLWRDIAQVLTKDLLQADFGAGSDLYVDFWTNDVKALQVDQAAEAKRKKDQSIAVKTLTDAGFDPAKSLEAVGLPVIPFIGKPEPTPPTATGEDDPNDPSDKDPEDDKGEA